MLYAIWAQDKNGAIGKDGKLPWHIPEDLKHFKDLTFGQDVIAGRKTFESLPAMPYRYLNIVSKGENIKNAYSLEELVEYYKLNTRFSAYIIGGAEIYKQTIDDIHMAFVTRVHMEVEDADAFAPEIPEHWHKIDSRDYLTQDQIKLTFEVWLNPDLADTTREVDRVYSYIREFSLDRDGGWNNSMLSPYGYAFSTRYKFKTCIAVESEGAKAVYVVGIESTFDGKEYVFEATLNNGRLQELQRQHFHTRIGR